MKIAMLWLTAVLLSPVTLAAQTEPKDKPQPAPTKADAGMRAPTGRARIASRVYVGEAAPGFELANARGARVKLSRFRGERVLLAFADRRESFSQYRAIADSLLASGVRLVGVCRGSPRSLRVLAERDSLGFELLSDSTGEVAAIYGAFDHASRTTLPGYVLVDRRGIVRLVVLGQSFPPDELHQLVHYTLTGM